MARLVAAEDEGGFIAGHGVRAQRPFESPLRKNTPAREIRVQIDSRYEFIDLVQKMAEDLCHVVRLGRGAAQNLGLAVREAVANAIKHGNRLDAGKHVLILFRVEAKRLVVAIRDQGSGFDPHRVENPVAPENVYHNHGRGIFFMNAFVDDVTFTRLPAGGTEVRLEKRVDRKRPGRSPVAGAPMRQGGRQP